MLHPWKICYNEGCNFTKHAGIKRTKKRVESGEVFLKKCSKCENADYCSRECQVADYPHHSLECKELLEAQSQEDTVEAMRSILAPLISKQVFDYETESPWFSYKLEKIMLPLGCMVCRFDTPEMALGFADSGFRDFTKIHRKWYPAPDSNPDLLEIPDIRRSTLILVKKTLKRFLERREVNGPGIFYTVLFIIDKPDGHPMYGKFNVQQAIKYQLMPLPYQIVMNLGTGEHRVVDPRFTDRVVKQITRKADRKAKKEQEKEEKRGEY